MRNLILLVILSAIFISCSENEEIFESDGIIFGQTYGACVGDCRNLYLLTAKGIYPDSNSDIVYGDWVNTTFDSQALPIGSFELANPLLTIPNELLEYEDEIGNQIIADVDFFIHIRINGISKTWLFDEIKDNMSTEIKQYIEKLTEINDQLKN